MAVNQFLTLNSANATKNTNHVKSKAAKAIKSPPNVKQLQDSLEIEVTKILRDGKRFKKYSSVDDGKIDIADNGNTITVTWPKYGQKSASVQKSLNAVVGHFHKKDSKTIDISGVPHKGIKKGTQSYQARCFIEAYKLGYDPKDIKTSFKPSQELLAEAQKSRTAYQQQQQQAKQAQGLPQKAPQGFNSQIPSIFPNQDRPGQQAAQAGQAARAALPQHPPTAAAAQAATTAAGAPPPTPPPPPTAVGTPPHLAEAATAKPPEVTPQEPTERPKSPEATDLPPPQAPPLPDLPPMAETPEPPPSTPAPEPPKAKAEAKDAPKHSYGPAPEPPQAKSSIKPPSGRAPEPPQSATKQEPQAEEKAQYKQINMSTSSNGAPMNPNVNNVNNVNLNQKAGNTPQGTPPRPYVTEESAKAAKEQRKIAEAKPKPTASLSKG